MNNFYSPKILKLMKLFPSKFKYCLLCSLLALLFILPTKAMAIGVTSTPEHASIFQSLSTDGIVNLTIETNLDSLMINKKKIVYQPATVRIQTTSNIDIIHEVKVSARGRSRRKYCDFPPLKLKFSKKGLADLGLSTNYKSIKLVTHCTDGAAAQNNVLEEYLAYKLYNEITDNSFKVQLVHINYIDSSTGTSSEKIGILIENTDEMAERLGGEENETMGLPVSAYDKDQLNKFAVFQYMIGNEDWRLNFLRNAKLVKVPSGKILPIPYDFDAAGLVNADYAKPDRDLRLKSVLQRQFMGDFANKKERTAVIEFFLAKKEALLETVGNCEQMDQAGKATAIAYLNTFFEVIENKSILNKAIPLRGKQPTASSITGAY